MFFKIKAYLTFLLKSTNQHGVHSPFVYSLVTNCFYKKTLKNVFKDFLAYKKSLINSSIIINVTDFGAGSKVFKSNSRPVAKIAKYAGISNPRAALLIRLSSYFKPKHILEIGTSLGLSTAALKLGAPNANLKSLEGCPETAKIAKTQLEKFQFELIDIHIGDFSKTLKSATENANFDLIYFDGNHKKEPTLAYFESCLKSINNDSVFIFDDIHWSAEMETAWKFIIEHPRVTVSIDTFQWGLVFFRKEQEKEHFIIRV